MAKKSKGGFLAKNSQLLIPLIAIAIQDRNQVALQHRVAFVVGRDAD